MKAKAPPIKKEPEIKKDEFGHRIPNFSAPNHSCGTLLTPTKLKHESVVYECKKCGEIVELPVTGEMK